MQTGKIDHRGLLGVAIATMLGLAGCVDTAQIKAGHQIDIPEAWAAANPVTADESARENVVLDAWLSDFQAPGLEALVAEAYLNNRDLQVAAGRVEEARAIVWLQTGAMLPALSVGGTRDRSRSNLSSGKLLGNGFAADLSLSWELDLWGKLNSERRASVLDYEAQGASFQYAQLSLAGAVVQSWFALVEAENQLALATETEASFSRAADMVRARYEQGLRRGLDVRLSASNAASARALSAARSEQVRRASTTLEVLLGRYPAGTLTGDGQLPVLATQTTDALPTELLTRRPDLSAVQARAVAAELRHSAALKAMLPSVRLTGSGGYRDSELKDLENPANLVWSLAGGIIQPLFQGGALKARADAAEARGDQALASYAQSLLTAFQEVESTLFAEETLAIREASMAEAAHEAVEAEKSASDLYSRGLTGIFELLEAQRRSLNAQSSWLEVRRQRLSNRVTLYLALGGGIPNVQEPVPARHAQMALDTPVSPVD